MGALNTHVNGSSGTCFDGARWFRAFARNAHLAGDHVQHTFQHGDGWSGPANLAYRASMRGTVPMCDDIGKACEQAAGALDTFGHELDSINKLMFQARQKARGVLEMHGPFILPPKPPGPAPQTPSGRMTHDEADKAVAKYEHAADIYKQQVHDYNIKARLFNECADLVREARKKEGNAHKELVDKMPNIGGSDTEFNATKVGKTTVSKALAYVSTAENSRRAAELKAIDSTRMQQFYQEMADRPPAVMTAEERAAYERSARESGIAAAEHTATAKEYERLVSKVPLRVRRALTLYPLRRQVELLTDSSSGLGKAMGGTLKKLPYISSGLVIGNEFTQAHKGEETFAQAAVHSAELIGAANAGAEAGTAAMEWAGPEGMVVGAVVGGGAAALGTQWAIDKIDPKEPQVAHAPVVDFQQDDQVQAGRHIEVTDGITKQYHPR